MAETCAICVDAIALPLIVVTHDGRLQMANSPGQLIIDSSEIVPVSNGGRVILGNRHGTEQMLKAIAAAESDGGPHAFQHEIDASRIAFCVRPYRPG